MGIAFREITPEQAEKFILSEKFELVEEKLTFVGFVGMVDPPRKETRPAILAAKRAGLDVIMITGDHVETAKAIGKEISLCSEDTFFSTKSRFFIFFAFHYGGKHVEGTLFILGLESRPERIQEGYSFLTTYL